MVQVLPLAVLLPAHDGFDWGGLGLKKMREFPKIRNLFFGVPVIRTVIFRVCIGSPSFRDTG